MKKSNVKRSLSEDSPKVSRRRVGPIPRNPYYEWSKTSITFPPTGLTKQSFKDECNMNNIISKYQATGQMPGNMQNPQYGDQPQLDLLQTKLALNSANEMFDNLPDKARGSFASVSDFIDAITDPSRASDLIEAGLIENPEPSTYVKELNTPPDTPVDPPKAEPSPDENS